MLRWATLWLSLGWVGVGALVLLSLLPAPQMELGLPNQDKWLHALAYALLMLWFCQIKRRPDLRLRYALLLTTIGVAIEVMQYYLPYRSGDWADGVADVVGVLCGWLLGLSRLGNALVILERRLGRVRP